jgi:DNA repair exonuclease SbcCD nuclease subunit
MLPLPRLLHTADWQIGKPFRWVEDTAKRSRLQQVRIAMIERLSALAQEHRPEALLVAGDLFDSAAVPTATVLEVLEAIASIACPVLVIPGNHDHGGAGGLWRRSDVQREMARRCPDLHLLLERRPVEIGDLVVLPCPLLRQHESDSPTAWLESLDWSQLPADRCRVVLAHGSVQGFGASDAELTAATAGRRSDSNRLRLERLPQEEIDYIALGDWHALHAVSDRCWYSGTPEPDRFPRTPDDQRGQVLLVELARGTRPAVTPLPTASLSWHNERISLRSAADLHRFDQWLERHIGRRVGRDLLRLELEGQLGLADHQLLRERLEDLRQALLHLRLRGHCHRRPEADELLALRGCPEGPLIRAVAEQLCQSLEARGEPGEMERLEVERLETALCELHRLTELERNAQETPCA